MAREDAQGSLFENELGIGNAVQITDDQMLLNIPKTRMVTRTAAINVKRSGVSFTESSMQTADISDMQPGFPEHYNETASNP